MTTINTEEDTVTINAFLNDYIKPAYQETVGFLSKINQNHIIPAVHYTNNFIDEVNQDYVKPAYQETARLLHKVNQNYILPSINTILEQDAKSEKIKDNQATTLGNDAQFDNLADNDL
jgi:hypothetical protein